MVDASRPVGLRAWRHVGGLGLRHRHTHIHTMHTGWDVPLILTDLSRVCSNPCYNPYEGLFA